MILAYLFMFLRVKKILVLGSGEFVWGTLLLAERLEKQGAIVKYSSTTRSPIATNFLLSNQR